MVVACETKFKSIYSQLVVPIIKMSKLGYVGEKNDQLLRKWFKIVQVCESLSIADVVEGTVDIVKDKKSLTSVSQSKVAELSKTQFFINEAVARDKQPIEFKPTGVNLVLDNQVPAANLSELEKRVTKPHKSHGVKSAIKKQIKSKLRRTVASGKLRLLLRLSVRRKDTTRLN